MTSSAASALAILFGLGVFLTIVAIGWRSVQHRRILRLQDAKGQETIIVAGEDDEVSSVVSTTETVPAAAASGSPASFAAGAEVANPAPAAGLRRAGQSETVAAAEADAAGRDRLSRVVASRE